MAPGVPSCSSSFIQSRRGARGVLAYRVLCVGLLVVMKWTRPLCGPAAMSQNDFKTSESIEPQEASPMKKLSVIGIDIAKQVFHLVGMDEQGTILVPNGCLLHTLKPIPLALQRHFNAMTTVGHGASRFFVAATRESPP